MNRKILFFDIDGTILSEETHCILPSTVEAIKKARENGHIAMINTGRTSIIVGDEIRNEIGFDGYIFGCGTSVLFQGKELMHQSIPAATAKKLIKELRAHRIDGVLEGQEFDYFDSYERMHTEDFRVFARNFDVARKDWDEEYPCFDKMYLFTSPSSDIKGFESIFTGEFEFIDRLRGFYEVIPRGFSKATGIQYMADYLGIPLEDTVAIGDSNNDLAMLEYAGTSIAMGNSSPDVLAVADYITTDVDNDGIWNALKWLNVI